MAFLSTFPIGSGIKEVPQATSDSVGGVKADPATENDTQAVRVGSDGKLYTVSSVASSIEIVRW